MIRFRLGRFRARDNRYHSPWWLWRCQRRDDQRIEEAEEAEAELPESEETLRTDGNP